MCRCQLELFAYDGVSGSLCHGSVAASCDNRHLRPGQGAAVCSCGWFCMWFLLYQHLQACSACIVYGKGSQCVWYPCAGVSAVVGVLWSGVSVFCVGLLLSGSGSTAGSTCHSTKTRIICWPSSLVARTCPLF
jgi:hypothetical protein